MLSRERLRTVGPQWDPSGTPVGPPDVTKRRLVTSDLLQWDPSGPQWGPSGTPVGRQWDPLDVTKRHLARLQWDLSGLSVGSQWASVGQSGILRVGQSQYSDPDVREAHFNTKANNHKCGNWQTLHGIRVCSQLGFHFTNTAHVPVPPTKRPRNFANAPTEAWPTEALV